MELTYKNNVYNYNVSDYCWSIIDSYKVKSRKDMQAILEYLSDNHGLLSGRTIKDMVYEWCVHNLFYDLHLFRSHTETVDMEANQKKYLKILYKCFSIFYWK